MKKINNKVIKNILIHFLFILLSFLISLMFFWVLTYATKNILTFFSRKIILLICLFLWIGLFALFEKSLFHFHKNKKKHKIDIKDNDKWMSIKEQKEILKSINDYEEYENSGWLWYSDIRTNGKSKNGKKYLNLKYHNSNGHILVLGSSGLGKTSYWVNPQIRLLANAKNKSSMFITDPKGELFNFHSKHLKNQGYEIKTINLRNEKNSSHWNPLTSIWETWNLGKDKDEKEYKKEEAIHEIDALTNSLFVSKNDNDKTWNSGAKLLFKGFCIAYLELSEKEEGFTKEAFNINNISNNISLCSNEYYTKMLIQRLGNSSEALKVMNSIILSGSNTLKSYLSTLTTKLGVFTNPKIKRITNYTDINFKELVKKPTALFIIVPDEDTSLYGMISLFVSSLYKKLIEIASITKENSLSIPWYFILDEFANMPKIDNFDSKISVARSRKIFFALIIQNYSQLDNKYNRYVADTIKSNCNTEIIFGINNPIHAEEISKKIGEEKYEYISKSIAKNEKKIERTSSNYSERTRRLIKANDITKLSYGEAIVKMQRQNPLLTDLADLRDYKKFNDSIGSIELKENKFESIKKYLFDFMFCKNKEKTSKKKNDDYSNLSSKTIYELDLIKLVYFASKKEYVVFENDKIIKILKSKVSAMKFIEEIRK